MTANGDAQIDTAQSKFGTASVLFDGTGDFLTTPDSSNWSFGTDDFTVDFWVRFNDLTGAQVFMGQQLNNSNKWTVQKNSGTHKLAITSTFGGVVKALYTMTNNWSASTNTWYHLAFQRRGTQGFIYIDGVSQALTASPAFGSNDMGDVTSSLYIGQGGNSSGYVNGWMDEIRVSKGIARYGDNFTPETAAYTGASQIVAGQQGTYLTLVGTDNTNTVTVRTGNGTDLTTPMVLTRGAMISLVYSTVTSQWSETSRLTGGVL